MIDVPHSSPELAEVLHAARESERTARALMDTPLSVVMLLSPDGTVIDCNETAAARFGLLPAHLRGKCIWDYLPEDIVRERKARGLEMLADGQPKRFVDRRDDKWFDNYIYPVADEDGRVTKVAVIAHDISELKQSEIRLQAAMQEVEQTNSKLQDALAQTKEMLVALQTGLAARSEFLSSITHEIRTPMNAILGFTQLMLETPDLPLTQREHLDGIRRAGGQLLAIVDDVLQMAKLESGKVALTQETTRVSDLCRVLTDGYTFRAEAKGIRLDIRMSPQLPEFIVIDVKKVHRVLSNLLENALKFTDTGHVQLRLSRGSDRLGHDVLTAEVEDTGQGIAQEEQKLLFTPFTRLRTESFQGRTGLGLSICRELVRLMGGNISVKSELGHGSVFTVEVPFSLPGQAEVVAGSAATVLEQPSYLAARMASLSPTAPADDEALVALRDLPLSMKKSLLDAAIAARTKTINEIAEALESQSPRLSRELRRISRHFEYQKLIDFLIEEGCL